MGKTYIMKHLFFYKIMMAGALLFSLLQARADTLTLDQGYQLAKANYPVLQQNLIQDNVLAVKLKEWNTRMMPSLQIKGTATYQSAVPELSISIPGQNLSLNLPKDRYQLYAELNQPIYDGGMLKAQKHLETTKNAIDKQRSLISEQQLKDQFVQTYFAILITDQQLEIMDATLKLLNSKQEVIASAVKEEVIQQGNLLKINAEIIGLKQKLRTVQQNRKAALEILSILTGQPVTDQTVLVSPSMSLPSNRDISRPELTMLNLQQQQLQSTMGLVSTQNRPKLAAFARGGVGYPNPFNFFDNKTSPFYYVGASMSWPVWNWGQVKKQKTGLQLQSEILDKQKENLVRNINIQLTQEAAEIEQLKTSLEDDRELLEIREKLREIASAQLDEGVITSSDYLESVTDAQQAKLNLEFRKIRLVYAQANYLNKQGLLFQ